MAKGDFALASGTQPNGGFMRVWFNESISPDEVSFDPDVYLLKRDRAKALRSGAEIVVNGQPPPGPEARNRHITVEEEQSRGGAVDETQTQPVIRTLALNGSIPAESGNKVGIRLIPKLRSAAQPKLNVSFSLEIQAGEAAHLVRELEQALVDLGLADKLKIELH